MYKVNLMETSVWPNPIWKASFDSWQRHFPPSEYQYMFWDDASLSIEFSKQCNDHISMFQSFGSEIFRSDLARYCILHKWGGIYSDLDYEPRANFFHDIQEGKVNIIESPYGSEKFQNSLMASPAGHPYWLDLLNLAEKRSNGGAACGSLPNGWLKISAWDLSWLNHEVASHVCDATQITGPRLLDAMSFVSPRDGGPNKPLRADVHVLPCKDFQKRTHGDDPSSWKPNCGSLDEYNVMHVKGIHWGTWSWNKDMGKGAVHCKQMLTLFTQLHGKQDLTQQNGFDFSRSRAPGRYISVIWAVSLISRIFNCF